MGQGASVTSNVFLCSSSSAPLICYDPRAQEKEFQTFKAGINDVKGGGSAKESSSSAQPKDETVIDDDDDSSAASDNTGRGSYSSLPNKLRKQSLADFMDSTRFKGSEKNESYIFNPDSELITVGDVVRVVLLDPNNPLEGIVTEKINRFKLMVDFGDKVKECLIANCVVLIRSDEFEVGDKVEAKPAGSNLYFVGKVIKVHEDKSIDVLMDGDDPDDIEYQIPEENARKLMSRRSVVVNRWRRAFMLVVTANLFKRIHFYPKEDKEASGGEGAAKDEK